MLIGTAVLLAGVLLNFASWGLSAKGGLTFWYFFYGIIVVGIGIIARAFILRK